MSKNGSRRKRKERRMRMKIITIIRIKSKGNKIKLILLSSFLCVQKTTFAYLPSS